MAEQLGALAPWVGGGAHAACLLAPLEALASVEESAVRDRAVASINLIIDALPEATVASEVWPLVRRLGDRDW
jgi:serine/threonine-protein phosphatase 2A regulatory subunit A